MGKNGFTLIEVILSLAIIGIITISMLSIFNIGFINIVRAGHRTEAVYMAENELLSNGISIGVDTKKVSLPSLNGYTDYNITGNIISGKVVYDSVGNSKIELEINTFIPNN